MRVFSTSHASPVGDIVTRLWVVRNSPFFASLLIVGHHSSLKADVIVPLLDEDFELEKQWF